MNPRRVARESTHDCCKEAFHIKNLLTAGYCAALPPSIMSLPSPVGPAGQLTIPLFVGTVMNWALLGTLTVQVYIYFLAFPKDRNISKCLVAFVVMAEILQTLGDTHDTIRIFGSEWGNYETLDEVGWSFFSVPVLGSLIASVGQLFFAWRIYIIGAGALVVPAVITIVTAVQLGAGIWTGVDIGRVANFSRLDFNTLRPPVVWLAATALSDLIIVAGTVFYVMKARQPGFRHMRAVLTRIIKITVETGVPCALLALLILVLYVKFDGNNFHLGACVWLSKVYSNSILVILNSRAQIGHNVAGSRSEPKSLGGMTGIVFQTPGGDLASNPARAPADTDSSCSTIQYSLQGESKRDAEMGLVN
ncbi:hypothetical protein B0H11DRAFT_1858328 [Mycena galericulata]|nr:hypothetical protein B0H11DRAFT_1858328 [Mycena galericulata]